MSTLSRVVPPALCALLLALAAAAHAADDRGAGVYFLSSHDTEDFASNAVAMELLPDYQHGSSHTGVRVTERTYSQGSWWRDGQQLSLIKRAVDPATANGWQLESSLYQVGAHGMLALDGSYHRPLAEKTGMDLFINRDWVETSASLDNGVKFTFYGASLDQNIAEHWTVVGMLGNQDFSDGNSRQHLRAKLVLQPSLDSGLTLQLHFRTYHSTQAAFGNYFNPATYDQTMLAVGWRKRIEGWVIRATAGAGYQHVNTDPETNTRLLEASLENPYRGSQFLRLRGGYNQSASFGGSDYAYTYLQGEWIVRY